MNSHHISQLIKTNLIYMNPQYTNQLRKKGKKGKKLVSSLLVQQGFLALLFLFTYSLIMLPVDLSTHPGFFTDYVALFTLMTVAQSVSVIFNVFYESNDLKDFLSLPFLTSEVFLAKFLVVALGTVPFILPIFSIFFITTIDIGMNILAAALFSLFFFLLFSLFIYTLSVLGISAFAQTKFFQQHQKLMTTGMMLLTSAGMIGGILYLNSQSNSDDMFIKDVPELVVFRPLYDAILQPTSFFSLCVIGVLILLTILAGFLIYDLIVPKFYQQSTQQIVQKVKRKKAGRSLNKMLVSYNLNLIKDPTLLMQSVMMTIIFPVAFLFPLLSMKGILSNLSPSYIGTFFLVGMAFSYLSVSSSSLVSVIISLDQERLPFMKSLPLSFKKYLKIKFWTMTFLQILLNLVILIPLALLMQVHLLFCLSLVLGNILGTYLLSEFYFYRDYRFLTLNWTNVSQLFTRGGGNFARMISMFVGYLILVILLVLFTLLLGLAPLFGSVMIVLIALGLLIGVHLYYQKKFWQKLV